MQKEHGQLGWWTAVCGLALVGLALRVLAAQGGLWTDEAWSVIYAAQARDAAGVFLRINHDNNHHLYSLWLQAIGPGASPMLARVPAIAAGTLCVVVAALLAERRSRAAGIVAALLFAVTPMLVAFGSEARGYAMMLLAALSMLLLVADAVDGRPVRGARWWLAVITLLGMFSHLTMAAPVAIAALWFYLERRSAAGPSAATRETARIVGPALAAAIFAIAFVFAAAVASPTGMRVGGYEPFSASHYAAALDDLAWWSVGLGSPWPWLIPLALGATALAVAALRPEWLGSRARLYALLILTVPVGLAFVRAGNTSFSRYYLASAIGLLLFMSEWIARGFSQRPAVRAMAAALVVTLVVAGLYRDSLLVAADRGRPAAPLAVMSALSPDGARVAFAEPRLKGVVAVAAERAGYAARFAGGCAPADFYLAARSRWSAEPTVPVVVRCGVRMREVDSSAAIPLTGDSWVLYARQDLAKPRVG